MVRVERALTPVPPAVRKKVEISIATAVIGVRRRATGVEPVPPLEQAVRNRCNSRLGRCLRVEGEGWERGGGRRRTNAGALGAIGRGRGRGVLLMRRARAIGQCNGSCWSGMVPRGMRMVMRVRVRVRVRVTKKGVFFSANRGRQG